jgi:hypothetical protein
MTFSFAPIILIGFLAGQLAPGSQIHTYGRNDERRILRAHTGDIIKLKFTNEFDSTYNFYITRQWTEFKVMPGAHRVPGKPFPVAFEGFKLISDSGPRSGHREWVFECIDPGKYQFPFKYSANRDRTNASSSTTFSLWIEVLP